MWLSRKEGRRRFEGCVWVACLVVVWRRGELVSRYLWVGRTALRCQESIQFRIRSRVLAALLLSHKLR